MIGTVNLGKSMMKAQQITQEYQREVTRVCVETALLLLQHGVESAVDFPDKFNAFCHA